MFKKFKAWLKATFTNHAKLIADSKAIIKTLRIIRQALGTPAAQNLVNIIPGQIDDRIFSAVKNGLDIVLKYADAIKDIQDILPQANDQTQNTILHKTASAALRQLYPSMDEATADLTIQKTYWRHF